MKALLERTRPIAAATLLACVVLGAVAAGALAVEAAPTIEPPGNQTSVVGKHVTLIVKGSNLATMTAKNLPAGLGAPTKVGAGETEWKIEGEPTVPESPTVTLEATNKEGAPATPVTFKWTINTPEPSPTIEPPGNQTSVVGKHATLIVKGTNLSSLTAKNLPAGFSAPTKVGGGETEWKIEGTPTTVEAPTVTLEATNKEGGPATPVTFKWTINTPEALPTIEAEPEQFATVGAPATLIVKGTNLSSLTAKNLPAGLNAPSKVGGGETEWKIEGTPTTVEAPTVTLEAANKEGAAPAGGPVTFAWTIEAAPTIMAPPNQTSTVGAAITAVAVKGTNLALLTPIELPAGLHLKQASETEWTIEGTPTTAKAATKVVLEPTNKAGGKGASVTFEWTVNAAPVPKKEAETPSKPIEKPSEPPPTPKPTSAGRLGTVPVQKQGHELFASFLCEVSACRVTLNAVITAGKTKFKIHSPATTIPEGKKVRIPLKLSKKQRTTIATALKNRKKVTAAISASIDSSIGLQLTKALVITVKR